MVHQQVPRIFPTREHFLALVGKRGRPFAKASLLHRFEALIKAARWRNPWE